MTRKIKIGSREIGGGNPILIQSMTNTDTRDVEATVRQILSLENAGCELIRCAVPDEIAAKALKQIKSEIHIPLIADIHFDYRLAVSAAENGADKIRINPGNMPKEHLKEIIDACTDKKIPIRVGVNSGSLEKKYLQKYNGVTAEGLAESAFDMIKVMEENGFYNLVAAIKSSDVKMSVKAYGLLSEKTDYPLHVGITEAGGVYSGIIKSAMGIGSILLDGIGDTIRVSLTADPIEEVKCAKQILKALALRNFGANVISCPTCGRTEINLIHLAEKVERYAETLVLDKPINIAVMGCVVNGPGEAHEADIGIAGGRGNGVIFRKGEVLKKVHEDDLYEELVKVIEEIV